MVLYKHKGILEITGKLYSGNVTEIQQQIEYALSRFKCLDINLTNINEIDISGIYMLYMVKRMVIEKKMNLSFTGITNMAFQNALRISGVNEKFLENEVRCS